MTWKVPLVDENGNRKLLGGGAGESLLWDTVLESWISGTPSTKGYILGGYPGTPTAVIEDLAFSNETSAAISATLDTAKSAGAGVNYGNL